MEVKDTLDLKRFPIVVKTDCKNIYRVYPLKQKIAAQLYKIGKEYEEIRRIYIFGSSVTSRCHIGSDIDICIDADVSDGMKRDIKEWVKYFKRCVGGPHNMRISNFRQQKKPHPRRFFVSRSDRI